MLTSFDVQYVFIELFKIWFAKGNHGWLSMEQFFDIYDKFRCEYIERYHFGKSSERS